MSGENVATIQTLFPTSDTNLVRLVHDDVDWTSFADRWAPVVDPEVLVRVGSGMGEATPTYIGFHGLREASKDWYAPWESFYIAELEMIDCGDRVLQLVEATARLPGSTSTVTLYGANVWTFRDGIVVSYESYPDRSDALKAVGLEE